MVSAENMCFIVYSDHLKGKMAVEPAMKLAIHQAFYLLSK